LTGQTTQYFDARLRQATCRQPAHLLDATYLEVLDDRVWIRASAVGVITAHVTLGWRIPHLPHHHEGLTAHWMVLLGSESYNTATTLGYPPFEQPFITLGIH